MKLPSTRCKYYWKNGLLLFFLFNGFLIGTALGENLAPNLFTWVEGTSDVTQQSQQPRMEVIRSHLARLHLDRMADTQSPEGVHQITLNLFEDVFLTAVKDRLERRSLANYTWFGHIASVPNSQVILTVEQGSMAGNIIVENEDYGVNAIYQIRPAPKGLLEIRQIDQSVFHEGGSDYIPVVIPPIDLPPNSQADDGSIIDVMVVYTATAAAASSNIAAEIQLGVDETNQSYLNSSINQRIRLAHKAQVSYTETGSLCGSSSDDLARLKGKSDGYLDNIHTWRDTYAADIVSLWVENGGSACGCGYLMENVSNAFAESAFNVVVRSCATGNYTFGHEMGHNMGARHDWYVDNDAAPYAYAHGYVNTINRWRTIMAYNNKCNDSGFNCTRIQYWSNPAVNYGGSPTGIAEGQPQAADNRKTLNNTAYTVANFRASLTLPDLVVTSVTSPNNGIAGGQITAAMVVNNQGTQTAGSFWAGFYLSPDTTITPSDINTGWGCTIPSLTAGASYSCSGPIGIPASVSTGTYYLGGYADSGNTVSESSETNNGRAATNQIAITGQPPATSRLVNISTRDWVGTGDNVMIAGFIIGGSSPKQVLIEAAGPSMASAGVPNVLPDPTLTLYSSGQTAIASNDDWQDSSQAAAIQATGLAPANPLESAILITLNPGAYTAIVRGFGTTTGNGLVAVFERDNPSARLINISTRGQTYTGDNVMIAGFIVSGSSPKKLLIRAIGPTLASAGVPNVLLNPTLTLYSGQTAIASNNDWQDSQAAAIQATGKAPTDPRESAILATLNPGAYTAIVLGLSATTGNTLVEVFEQP